MIKALCRQDPSERIGYQRAGVADIRKHRWFQVIYCFTFDLFNSRFFRDSIGMHYETNHYQLHMCPRLNPALMSAILKRFVKKI